VLLLVDDLIHPYQEGVQRLECGVLRCQIVIAKGVKVCLGVVNRYVKTFCECFEMRR
jgi:hypothetical protein